MIQLLNILKVLVKLVGGIVLLAITLLASINIIFAFDKDTYKSGLGVLDEPVYWWMRHQANNSSTYRDQILRIEDPTLIELALKGYITQRMINYKKSQANLHDSARRAQSAEIERGSQELFSQIGRDSVNQFNETLTSDASKCRWKIPADSKVKKLLEDLAVVTEVEYADLASAWSAGQRGSCLDLEAFSRHLELSGVKRPKRVTSWVKSELE